MRANSFQVLQSPKLPGVEMRFASMSPQLIAGSRSQQLWAETPRRVELALRQVFAKYTPAIGAAFEPLVGRVARRERQIHMLTGSLADLGAFACLQGLAGHDVDGTLLEASAWHLYARPTIHSYAPLMTLYVDELPMPLELLPVLTSRQLKTQRRGRGDTHRSGWRIVSDTPRISEEPHSVPWPQAVKRLGGIRGMTNGSARTKIFTLFPSVGRAWRTSEAWMLRARVDQQYQWGIAIAEQGPYYLFGAGNQGKVKLQQLEVGGAWQCLRH